jgi:hypothetical protein
MTQADSVLSTPPTNTSANTPHKPAEVLSRRSILAVIGAVTALPIATPIVASATQSPDPIYEIIEKHRTAAAAFKEAVGVEFTYEKNRSECEAMDPVERQTYQSTFDSLQASTREADDQMHEASIDLVNTPPTSLAGIIALCEYFGPQVDEKHNLPDEIDWDDGTQSTPAGAFANAIRSAVAAMVQS